MKCHNKEVQLSRGIERRDEENTMITHNSTAIDIQIKKKYSNILKTSPPKTGSSQIKILIFFIFLLKT